MKSTIQTILDFDLSKMSFESSSGYAGFRDPMTEKWYYADEVRGIQQLQSRIKEYMKLLHDFRRDCLPFGSYPDYTILEFLEKNLLTQDFPEFKESNQLVIDKLLS